MAALTRRVRGGWLAVHASAVPRYDFAADWLPEEAPRRSRRSRPACAAAAVAAASAAAAAAEATTGGAASAAAATRRPRTAAAAEAATVAAAGVAASRGSSRSCLVSFYTGEKIVVMYRDGDVQRQRLGDAVKLLRVSHWGVEPAEEKDEDEEEGAEEEAAAANRTEYAEVAEAMEVQANQCPGSLARSASGAESKPADAAECYRLRRGGGRRRRRSS